MDLPVSPRVLRVWSKQLREAKVERRERKKRKSRTFSRSSNEYSITASSHRDAHEERWHAKNRKDGTVGSDNYVSSGTSTDSQSNVGDRHLGRTKEEVTRKVARTTQTQVQIWMSKAIRYKRKVLGYQRQSLIVQRLRPFIMLALSHTCLRHVSNSSKKVKSS